MYNPVIYKKNNKNIIDYTLKYPDNLTIYFDLIIESLDTIEKKISNQITKLNRIQKKLFNYVYPNYSLSINKTNYYVSRAYLDGEIDINQIVYVYCFIEKTEIFPIDWDFINILELNKTKLIQYKNLQIPGVYILELQDNKYYIGSSHNIYRRLIQHWSGNGSKWTSLFKPLKLITWIPTDTSELLKIENLITNAYVSKYSILQVRGGSFYI